jgi:hypothetical protein
MISESTMSKLPDLEGLAIFAKDIVVFGAGDGRVEFNTDSDSEVLLGSSAPSARAVRARPELANQCSVDKIRQYTSERPAHASGLVGTG